MKLSFTKSSSKPKHQQNAFDPSQRVGSSVNNDVSASAEKQFVTEFDPSKTLATNQRSHRLVIPPKANEWRPLKKMKNLELPLGSADDEGTALQFEVATDTIGNGEGSNMSFGLNLRNSSMDESDLKVGYSKPSSIETLMMQKFKEDMNDLPESVMEDYDEMPVEGFGAALLAGYGWVEGRGIGKNAKEDVKIVEYKRWTGKEGLGFQPAEHVDKREKLDDDPEYKVGQEIRIIHGRDAGTLGKITKIANDGKSVVLRLPKIDEEVKLQTEDIAALGSAEEEKCLKKLKELKIQVSKDEIVSHNGRSYRESSREDTSLHDNKNQSKRSREGEARRSYQREEPKKKIYSSSSPEARRSYQREEPKKKISSSSSPAPSWLTSHIRVRVISKKLKGGRLYLKKGKVLDVVGPTTCDISMDETGEIIQGVDQVVLETALPRRGGPVLVLYGKHKGMYGSLIEKDNETERGVVRDADNQGLVNVKLEQIAEFTGDPECLGY